jgi:radical SAM protein with 4Fe4S-binding SPASM domain
MNLISQNPKIRKQDKLFNSFKSKFSLADNKSIYKRLILLNEKNSIDKYKKDILTKVINSYKQLFKNITLELDDFVFSEHELFQTKNLSDNDLIRYVIYRYEFNIFPKIKKIKDYPLNVQLELSSICNLRCIMCYQHDKSFSSKSKGFMGYMNLDLFKKIIDELEGKLEAITFASRGEPTLNKDLEKYLKYCEKKFIGLKLNTNATMFNEKIINVLLSSDLETLVISADAPDKEFYERIRVNAKFDKLIKNLELFKNIKEKKYKNSQLKVRVSGVKINNNQSFEKMYNFYSQYADEVSLMDYLPWQNSYDNEINDVSSPCSELYRMMYIFWDGTVNPCDFDYKNTLSKWNAKTQTVKDIWKSKYYNELRDKHSSNRRKDIEPCKRCIVT